MVEKFETFRGKKLLWLKCLEKFRGRNFREKGQKQRKRETKVSSFTVLDSKSYNNINFNVTNFRGN